MKVIFLDIDGVLNSNEYINRAKKLKIKGIERELDIEKIKLLKKAIDETGAKVVLSSTWRLTSNLKDLKELFAKYGIYIDSTPFIENERGLEIKQWLSENIDVDDFVILDDVVYDSYDEELLKKLIKISNGNGYDLGEGMNYDDVKEIVKRLGKKITKEKSSEECER